MPHMQMQSWTSTDVAKWLHSINFECYAKTLLPLTGLELLDMSSEKLEDLGIPRHTSERIMMHIANLERELSGEVEVAEDVSDGEDSIRDRGGPRQVIHGGRYNNNASDSDEGMRTPSHGGHGGLRADVHDLDDGIVDDDNDGSADFGYPHHTVSPVAELPSKSQRQQRQRPIRGRPQQRAIISLSDDDLLDDDFIADDDDDDDDDPVNSPTVAPIIQKRLRPTSGRHRPQSARRPGSAPPLRCSESATTDNKGVVQESNSNNASVKRVNKGNRPQSALAATTYSDTNKKSSNSTNRGNSTGLTGDKQSMSNGRRIKGEALGSNRVVAGGGSGGGTGSRMSRGSSRRGGGSDGGGSTFGSDNIVSSRARAGCRSSSNAVSLEQCVQLGLIVADTELSFDIEYCTECAHHATTTRHDPRKYKSVAEGVGNLILEKLPGCTVTYNLTRTLKVGWTPRLGSMEVVVSWRTGKALYQLPLYSKILSRKFPNPELIVGQIAASLPERQRVTCVCTDAMSGVPMPHTTLRVLRADESRALMGTLTTDSGGAADILLGDGHYVVEGQSTSHRAGHVPFKVTAVTTGICLPLCPSVPSDMLLVTLSWANVPSVLDLVAVTKHGVVARGSPVVANGNIKLRTRNRSSGYGGYGPSSLLMKRPVDGTVQICVIGTVGSGVPLIDSCAHLVLHGARGVLAECQISDTTSVGGVGGGNGGGGGGGGGASASDLAFLRSGGGCWSVLTLEDDGERVAVAGTNSIIIKPDFEFDVPLHDPNEDQVDANANVGDVDVDVDVDVDANVDVDASNESKELCATDSQSGATTRNHDKAAAERERVVVHADGLRNVHGDNSDALDDSSVDNSEIEDSDVADTDVAETFTDGANDNDDDDDGDGDGVSEIINTDVRSTVVNASSTRGVERGSKKLQRPTSERGRAREERHWTAADDEEDGIIDLLDDDDDDDDDSSVPDAMTIAR